MAALLGLGLSGCGLGSETAASGPSEEAEDGDDPKLVSEYEPGLRLLSAEQADRDGHLVELIVHEGYVYTANSNGIVTMRLEDGGGLTMTDNGKAAAGMWTSCNSLAVHAASDTLYCAADRPSMGDPRIEVYDLSDPAAPILREPFVLDAWAVRDVEVVGDTLLINQFDDGLWTASVGELGELSGLSKTEVEGNVRFTVAVGERLVVAVAELEGAGTQLRVLDGSSFAELDRLSLSGPPLGLSADSEGASAVAVALGSGGVALVDLLGDELPEQLSLRSTLEPPAVVAHALLAGDRAFAITLSGAFVWALDASLTPGPARLFGFGPESAGAAAREGNMLHAAVYEGELLTSDWTWVERWAVDEGGEVTALDVPRGVYVHPYGAVRWRLRNPGSLTLRAEHWAGGRHVFDVELGPHSVETVELDGGTRALLLQGDEPSMMFGLRVHDPSVDSGGEPLSISSMMILQRDLNDELPPAVGETLPTITLADIDKQLFTVPDSRRLRLVWYSPDCALMWPEFEDLAWAARVGLDIGQGDPIYISQNDVSYGFARRWGLEAVEFGLFGPTAPPEVDAANAGLGGQDLLEIFMINELPGNADTSDYVVDASGTVLSIERMYRGSWSLAEPAPWD